MILQWNINGLVNRLPELELLLSSYNPCCVCLQESHLRPDEVFNLRGYNILRCDVDPGQRAHGGTIILLVDDMPFEPCALRTRLQAVACTVYTPNGTVTICNVYLPDNVWTVGDLETLERQLKPPYIIMGDFNSHSTVWGSHSTDSRGRMVEDFLDGSDVVLLNTGSPTFLNVRSGTTSAIDLTMVSPTIAPRLGWEVLDDPCGSDHLPILVRWADGRRISQYEPRWRLDLANWTKYEESFVVPQLSHNIETSLENIKSAIMSAASSSIPKTSGRPRKRKVPWWNEHIAAAVAEKRYAYRRYRRDPSMENLIEFKKSRAVARRAILHGKRESWREFVASTNSELSVSELWRRIHAMYGRSDFRKITSLQVNGIMYTEMPAIADQFRRQFGSVSGTANYSAAFLRHKDRLEVPLDFTSSRQHSYNLPFTLDEMSQVLSNTPNSAPGRDGISYAMLRHMPVEMKGRVLEYLNTLWTTGAYPCEWREAVVVPLLKPGKDPTLPISYRPVSLTSHLAKVYEKLVCNRLVWLLESRNLLNKFQCGSRKHHSTTDAHVSIVTAIQTAFLKRQHLAAVCFDLEKAFDMTWRHGILKKLHEWGFRGNLPLFIQQFLSSRTFSVRVGNVYSQSQDLENGVPQGSTISVVLFLIAINDIAANLPGSVYHVQYVDDLVIFTSARTTALCRLRLQRAIDGLSRKADELGFRFSAEKTKCIDFSRLRRAESPLKLMLGGSCIELVNEVKILGITFDSKLTWKRHIDQMVSTCRKSLNVIKCLSSIRWGSDVSTLTHLYTSIVLSKMDFGAIVYSTAKPSHLRRLASVHAAGVRFALGAFRTSPLKSLHVESGIQPLHIRHLRLRLNYASRIWFRPDHMNYDLLYRNEQIARLLRGRPSSTKPVAWDLRLSMESILSGSEECIPERASRYPPWCVSRMATETSLSLLPKESTPHELYRVRFHSLLDRYADHRHIYTDGSKTAERTGCAFVLEDDAHSFRLSPMCSVFTAELTAIDRALRHCLESRDTRDILICTDSLSAISSIVGVHSCDPVVLRIQEHVSDLAASRVRTTFMWVPGHVGIRGNEAADEAARTAASSPEAVLRHVRPDDLRRVTVTHAEEVWQHEWNRVSAALRALQPSVQRSRVARNLSRREQVVLTRLRIGHTNLTSSHYLVGAEEPVCDVCRVSLTVQHILVECRKYAQLRVTHGLNGELADILSKDGGHVGPLIEFLKAAGIFYRI